MDEQLDPECDCDQCAGINYGEMDEPNREDDTSDYDAILDRAMERIERRTVQYA
jgi:hypothetical protein